MNKVSELLAKLETELRNGGMSESITKELVHEGKKLHRVNNTAHQIRARLEKIVNAHNEYVFQTLLNTFHAQGKDYCTACHRVTNGLGKTYYGHVCMAPNQIHTVCVECEHTYSKKSIAHDIVPCKNTPYGVWREDRDTGRWSKVLEEISDAQRYYLLIRQLLELSEYTTLRYLLFSKNIFTDSLRRYTREERERLNIEF